MTKNITLPIFLLLLLFSTSAFAERISVSSSSAVVRSGPGAKYEIAWENLDTNYPLFVLEKKESWYYVRDYENDVGWIHKSYIGKAKTVITKKNGCNVRSGPAQNNPVNFDVDNGVPFKVLRTKGKWINIQHSDGDKGWIHKNLVW